MIFWRACGNECCVAVICNKRNNMTIAENHQDSYQCYLLFLIVFFSDVYPKEIIFIDTNQ